MTCTQYESTHWEARGNPYDTTWYTAYVDALSAIAGDSVTVSGAVYPVTAVSSNAVQSFVLTYNPCSPLLGIPNTIYSLNSLWTGCQPGITAFYDPPVTLTPGVGMSAFGGAAPASVVSGVTTSSATAGATPDPSTPVVCISVPTSFDILVS